LEHCPLEDSNMLAILNSNLAICYLKNEDYEGVVHYATEALKYDPLFKKALLNRAFCYERKDQIEEAFEGSFYESIPQIIRSLRSWSPITESTARRGPTCRPRWSSSKRNERRRYFQG
jgi:tetratricopeptide (TPR) repeat protein